HFLGKIHQRVDGSTLDRAVLDVGRPRRLGAITGIVQHRVDGRVSGDLVGLLPEGVGRPLVFLLRQVTGRDDQLRVGFGGNLAGTVHRTQRRLRTIGADHYGLIGRHLPSTASFLTVRPVSSCLAGASLAADTMQATSLPPRTTLIVSPAATRSKHRPARFRSSSSPTHPLASGVMASTDSIRATSLPCRMTWIVSPAPTRSRYPQELLRSWPKPITCRIALRSLWSVVEK